MSEADVIHPSSSVSPPLFSSHISLFSLSLWVSLEKSHLHDEERRPHDSKQTHSVHELFPLQNIGVWNFSVGIAVGVEHFYEGSLSIRNSELIVTPTQHLKFLFIVSRSKCAGFFSNVSVIKWDPSSKKMSQGTHRRNSPLTFYNKFSQDETLQYNARLSLLLLIVTERAAFRLVLVRSGPIINIIQ